MWIETNNYPNKRTLKNILINKISIAGLVFSILAWCNNDNSQKDISRILDPNTDDVVGINFGGTTIPKSAIMPTSKRKTVEISFKNIKIPGRDK